MLADLGAVEVLDELAQALGLLRVLLELDPRVQVLGVLAHDHEVGLGEAGAHALVGLARPDAGVQVELLAQQHVDGAEAGADRRRRRALDPDPVALDRLERAIGEGVALVAVDVLAGRLLVPGELDAGRLEHAASRLRQLGTGAVTRDEGDFVCHMTPLRFRCAAMLCDHGYPMTGSRSLPLLRIFGIRIGVNYSWFLVLFVVIFVLWDSLSETLDASNTTVYVVAVVAAASFFASIVAHELGHALAARREGIAVEGIDLFLFGGVMKMSRDTDSPGAEFRVAAAGPLVTLVLMLLALGAAVLLAGVDSFWDAARLSGTADASPPEVVVSLLVSMNLLLLLFNLVPAFPLDGGRIARAAAWKVTGDRHRATRFAARIGIGFGWLLILGGLMLVVFSEGRAFDGIWFAALGWLLASAARGTLAQTRFTEQLAGITVADVKDSEPVTIPARLTAAQAYDEYFLRYQGWEWFAVVEDDGRYAGLAHRQAVEHAALQEGGAMPVREVAAPGADEGQVPADAPLEALLASEPLRRLGALMAVDGDGRLRGVVTFEQVTRALRTRLAPS